MKTLQREFKTFCVPDKDDFDFGRWALNNGGCILVTVAIKNLPVDLKGYKNIELQTLFSNILSTLESRTTVINHILPPAARPPPPYARLCLPPRWGLFPPQTHSCGSGPCSRPGWGPGLSSLSPARSCAGRLGGCHSAGLCSLKRGRWEARKTDDNTAVKCQICLEPALPCHRDAPQGAGIWIWWDAWSRKVKVLNVTLLTFYFQHHFLSLCLNLVSIVIPRLLTPGPLSFSIHLSCLWCVR